MYGIREYKYGFGGEQSKNKSAPNDHPIIESTFALN